MVSPLTGKVGGAFLNFDMTPRNYVEHGCNRQTPKAALVVCVLVFLSSLVSAPSLHAEEPKERPTIWGQDIHNYLRDFDEKMLWKGSRRGKTYRLIVDHSHTFRKTVIRLDQRSNGRWLMTTKHVHGDERRVWERFLKASEVDDLLAILNKEEFWELEGNLELVEKTPSADGVLDSICLHPLYFVMEARLHDQYHGMGLYVCGSDELFVPAGFLMIKLVGKDLGYLD